MAGKIECTDADDNTVTHYIKGNTVKGYIIKDGQMTLKPGYNNDENNTVIITKQKSNESIGYKLLKFIKKL